MFRSNTIPGQQLYKFFLLLLIVTFVAPALAQPEPDDERAIDVPVDTKLEGFFSGDAQTSIDQIESV